MQRAMLAGLIGAKIQRSISPALFEDACAAAGLRGHYHLMDLDLLPGRGIGDLLQSVRTAGFRGTNVTYPCKETVLPLLDTVSQEARQIGAVNAVVIAADGRTTGHNTDRSGFRRAFDEELGRQSAHDQTVLLLGAGGAGRAVAFALFDLGVRTLLVSDTNPAQANGLVAALNAAFGPGRAAIVTDPAAALADAAGVVNATPIGMSGIPGVPISVDAITSRHWVADVIYSPLETELLVACRARGARIMGGAGMCIHQAAGTFELFTGLSADLGRMRGSFAAAAARRSLASAEVTREEA